MLNLLLFLISDWVGLAWLIVLALLLAFLFNFASMKYLFQQSKVLFWIAITAALGFVSSMATGLLGFQFKSVLAAFGLGIIVSLIFTNEKSFFNTGNVAVAEANMRSSQIKYLFGLAAFLFAAVIAGKIFFKSLSIA